MSEPITQHHFSKDYVQLKRGTEWLCTCKAADADAIQALLEGKDGSSDNQANKEE